MKLYKYNNYDEYVAAQSAANKRKIHKVWVNPDTIKRIAVDTIQADNVLCHGTRNGKEQILFKQAFPDAYVLGTEISDTASTFPYTIQHDFHEVNNEWINKFDIIYSNSWDHSYDPKKSLSTWIDQLNENGRLYIEQALDPSDNRSRESDPLEIYHSEILELFELLNIKLIGTFNSTGAGDHPCIVYTTTKETENDSRKNK